MTQHALPVVRTARSCALALLLGLAGGCSSFHGDWKKAAAVPAAPNDVQGRWEGLWISDANGHQGKLKCILTKQGDRTYEAKFYATYKKILSFGYTAQLNGSVSEVSTNVVKIEGQADLGKLAGGVYEYKGAVSPTNFFSTYNSKYDHGTFQMKRPK